MMKIHKIAHVDEGDIPDPNALASYIRVLKLYLEDNEIEPNLIRLIKGLPSPRAVKSVYSWEECKILFETINYLWKKILGSDILEQAYVEKAQQAYLGNYWIFKNGIIINGENHFTAIQRDCGLVTTLLNLNGFTLQYYLSNPPNKLIRYILKSGGVRMFVNKDNKGYFQMTEGTYAKWGRAKVKKYDLNLKIVKIIDMKVPFRGWSSGIPVKL